MRLTAHLGLVDKSDLETRIGLAHIFFDLCAQVTDNKDKFSVWQVGDGGKRVQQMVDH